MSDNIVYPSCFTERAGRVLLRVDVAMEAAQHFAFIEPDLAACRELMDAARSALEEGSAWAEVSTVIRNRVKEIDYAELDQRIQAESRQAQEAKQ